MELGKPNLFSEHQIHKVLEDHPSDGWDLLQQGRISPDTLEEIAKPEAPDNLATVSRLGHVAEVGADVQRPIAA